jgi:hypothetical protein
VKKRILAVDDEPNATLTLLSLEETVLFEVDHSTFLRHIYSVSSLTNQAFASKKSFRQTAAQSCINEDSRCQSLLNQIQGHDNAGTVTGNQPD